MSDFVAVGDLKPGTKVIYSYGSMDLTGNLGIKMTTVKGVVGQRVTPMRSNTERVELVSATGKHLGNLRLNTSVKLR